MSDTWKTSMGCPHPRHSEISSCSCYFVFTPLALDFNVVATFLHQLSEPEAKALPLMKPALLPLHPAHPSVRLRQSSHCCPLPSHSSVFPICGSAWPSGLSMPMWLSSPQGSVKVSRRGWRVPAQSVTNASGWSAVPRGTLFHSSVVTRLQSPQELLKVEEFVSVTADASSCLSEPTQSPILNSLSCCLIPLLCFASFSRFGE